MIVYNLQCEHGHEFEGWFPSAHGCDEQIGAGHVSCAQCGSTNVSKAIMAPAVRGTKKQNLADYTNTMQAELAALRAHVETNCEDVGEKFPDEARKIHYGETEERGIFGTAGPKDVKELLEEGIGVAPLPPTKPKSN